MTSRSSFFANSSDLPAIQEAVKRHNMRFVSNPAPWMQKLARMSVTVEADDMADFNGGVRAIDAITRPPEMDQWSQSDSIGAQPRWTIVRYLIHIRSWRQALAVALGRRLPWM